MSTLIPISELDVSQPLNKNIDYEYHCQDHSPQRHKIRKSVRDIKILLDSYEKTTLFGLVLDQVGSFKGCVDEIERNVTVAAIPALTRIERGAPPIRASK